MASFRELAPSHLVKVRDGQRGSGWAIGRQGVLTARHVVQLFLEKKVDHCWAVLDPSPEGPGFACSVVYEDDQRDLAVLKVDDDQAEAWQQAIGPGATVLAKPGTQTVAVEAIGFPDATLGEGGVPDPEPISGELRPAGGAVTGLMPLDVGGSVPETSRAWNGMSGAVVSDSSHRLVGVIVEVNRDRQQRRMYVAVLPDPQEDDRFASALSQIGGPTVVEAAEAPKARNLVDLLDAAGRPYRVDRITDLKLLGTRRSRTDIDIRGDPFYPYLPRDIDQDLDAALDARARGADPRLLLLVGVAMAGKSRTLAEALRRQATLSNWLVVPPQEDANLDAIVELYPGNVVLWLDDLEKFLPRLNADRLRRVLARPSVAVMSTVRMDRLQSLTDQPNLRSAWDLVNDSRLVQRIDLPTAWTELEKRPLQDREAVLRNAVAADKPLGEALGAADEMLRMLQNLSGWQRALAGLIADWPRTGITTPLPEDKAIGLWAAYLTSAAADIFNDLPDDERQHRYEEARSHLTRPVAAGAMTSLVERRKGGLITDGFLIQQRSQTNAVLPDPVWDSALAWAADGENPGPVTYAIGQQAAIAGNIPIAMKAWQPFAEGGNKETLFNLGLLFERSGDAASANFWYEQAAAAGDLGGMFKLGELVEDTNRAAALDWYEQAAAAGDSASMVKLALLKKDDLAAARGWWQQAAAADNVGAMIVQAALMFEEGDTAAAQGWYGRAAERGDSMAMFQLGLLLDDTNRAAALDWHKQAAAAGNADAMYRLGVLLARDDPVAAGSWWEQAAAAGETNAMARLGLLLVYQDPAKAQDWWEQAAAAGNAAAMFNLGQLLMESDPTAARHWWEQAAAAGQPDAIEGLRRNSSN